MPPTFLFSQSAIIEWEKGFGGSGQEYSGGIVQHQEGGYLMTVNTESIDGDFDQNKGDTDLWLVKLNETGEVEWKRNYGGSFRDSAPNIFALSDGSYLILGDTDSNDGDISLNRGWSDGWAMKVDSIGDILWSKTYGGSSPDFLKNMIELPDGALLLCGRTLSNDGDIDQNHGDYDVWIVKLDSFGELKWSKTYGGSEYEGGEIYSLNNNDFLVAAYSDSDDGDVPENAGGTDAWVFKINEEGNIISSHAYGGSKDESLRLVKTFDDGSMFFCGSSNSIDSDLKDNNGKQDYWVLKTASTGNVLESQTYGGTERDGGCIPLLLPNENILLSGTSFSDDGQVSGNYGDISLRDIWLLEINENRDIVWGKNYGGSKDDVLMSLIETKDGFLLMATSESSDHDVSENKGLKDIWLAKFLFPPSEEVKGCDFKVAPNPIMYGMVSIDFEVPMVGDYYVNIYNVAGQLACRERMENRITKEAQMEVSNNIASGLYFLQVEGNGHRCTEKVLLAK